MKKVASKITTVAATLLLLAMLVMPARAQIIYNSIIATGLVSAPILTQFAVTSNTVSAPVTQHSILLTNIFTNFTYTFNYGALLVGQSGTNFQILSTMTTNFSAANGWTNGASWSYTFPATQINTAITPWGSVQVFTNSTGVLFQ